MYLQITKPEKAESNTIVRSVREVRETNIPSDEDRGLEPLPIPAKPKVIEETF